MIYRSNTVPYAASSPLPYSRPYVPLQQDEAPTPYEHRYEALRPPRARGPVLRAAEAVADVLPDGLGRAFRAVGSAVGQAGASVVRAVGGVAEDLTGWGGLRRAGETGLDEARRFAGAGRAASDYEVVDSAGAMIPYVALSYFAPAAVSPYMFAESYAGTKAQTGSRAAASAAGAGSLAIWGGPFTRVLSPALRFLPAGTKPVASLYARMSASEAYDRIVTDAAAESVFAGYWDSVMQRGLPSAGPPPADPPAPRPTRMYAAWEDLDEWDAAARTALSGKAGYIDALRRLNDGTARSSDAGPLGALAGPDRR